ncbi:MAG: HlyD family efflux transporter periplasmic adaptor subunit [Oscillospiraceae bacterium]|nr:HlyD family efflux transporter periplasmic adaptor subunit [Oscillospiraceae bacterium]
MDEKKRTDDALFAALNKSKKKKKRKTAITALIIIAIIAVALLITVNVLRRRVDASIARDQDEVLRYDAAYGAISTRVSASGIIEDVDTEVVSVPEGVEIDEVVVRAGNVLHEGDVVATLDLTTVLSSMATVQSEIEELDKELADAGNDKVASSVRAGAAGRVKRIFVAPQDDVASCMVENGALALISLDGKMAVDFENSALTAGQAVSVEREDGSVIAGTVDKNVGGTVTVLVTDNGPRLDEAVRILDADGNELGAGELYIHSVFRVTGFAGTVSTVSARENQQVYASSSICSLSNTSYSARYNSILKQRKDKEDTLLELLGLYQGGALRAPFDGTVLRVDYDADEADTAAQSATPSYSSMDSYYSYFMGGTTTAPTTATTADTSNIAGTAVVTMARDESMLVRISVDESDILSLEKGQIAEVSIDSVGAEKLGGVVTEVDRTADSTSGVSSYSAEVTFAKGAGMLSGMTADVVINIEGTENVLIVPTDAIHKTSAGAFVYTSYDEETKQYGGMTPVELGISNDEFTEIRSGLEEGTTVFYTEKEVDFFAMMMGGPRGGGFRG